MNNKGSADIFLLCINQNGNALWTKSVGGTDFEENTHLNIDSAGNIFVSGLYTSKEIFFGGDTLYGGDTILVYTSPVVEKKYLY